MNSNLKMVWLLSGIVALIFVPLKIISSLNTIDFVENGWFMGMFFILVGMIMLFTFLSKTAINNIEIKKNIPLAIVSIIVSVTFFWCISTYYNDNSQYDFEWQPVLMGIFSVLTCITFIIMAVTFFTGKNIFSKLPFFIFCPIFWFALNMLLFLSIQNDNNDIYDITLTALLSLFFVYYTQVFATCSKFNIVKLLIGLGIPSVLLAFVKCIPVIINFVKDSQSVSEISLSTCTMEGVVAIYILLVIIDTYTQISKKSEVCVKSLKTNS